MKVISGTSEQDLWQQVIHDMGPDADLMEYEVMLQLNGSSVRLSIDVDMGGGFEGGISFTTFTGEVAAGPDFRFALHHEGLIDKAGKFFGMEDVVIGYPEFDKKLIVKTNDAARVKQVFAEGSVRAIFQDLHEFTLAIERVEQEGSDEKVPVLQLAIERAVVETDQLRTLYSAFYALMKAIDATR